MDLRGSIPLTLFPPPRVSPILVLQMRKLCCERGSHGPRPPTKKGPDQPPALQLPLPASHFTSPTGTHTRGECPRPPISSWVLRSYLRGPGPGKGSEATRTDGRHANPEDGHTASSRLALASPSLSEGPGPKEGPEPFRIQGICSHRVSGRSGLTGFFPVKKVQEPRRMDRARADRKCCQPTSPKSQAQTATGTGRDGTRTPPGSVPFLRHRRTKPS